MRFRTRAMLASSLLAAGLIAVAPAASAQEDGDVEGLSEEQIEGIIHEAEEIAVTNGATEFDAECIPILVDGGSPEDCNEAPSPILPATDELVWGGLSFLVLLFLMWKFAFPAVKKGMEARTERIRGDLDAAENAKSEAVGVLDGYKAQLADAKSEAARIIEEARQSADALKKDQEARLQTELAEARARAAADIDAAKAQATADLRGELATLAVGAASAVVNKNLDAAAQTQLIEDYINQVGSAP
ncbi:MAG: F0F1 ATP synthase subunit B [Acidimicrobiales bacterium]